LQLRSAEGNQLGNGQLQYQTSFGRYELGFDPLHPNQSRSFNASGGLVYQDGHVLFTRAVQESFGLIRIPDVENVRVYVSNQLVGRTDRHGDLLVPSMLSYYGNRVRIEDKDIPLDYEVAAIERTVAPPYRGGALIEFPVRRVQTVSGELVVKRGEADVIPAYGQLAVAQQGGQSSASPLGGGGEFYLENIASGTYTATVEYAGGTCEFNLQIPATTESFIQLGRVVCVEKAR
jgi:outer membrane usher protein